MTLEPVCADFNGLLSVCAVQIKPRVLRFHCVVPPRPAALLQTNPRFVRHLLHNRCLSYQNLICISIPLCKRVAIFILFMFGYSQPSVRELYGEGGVRLICLYVAL